MLHRIFLSWVGYLSFPTVTSFLQRTIEKQKYTLRAYWISILNASSSLNQVKNFSPNSCFCSFCHKHSVSSICPLPLHSHLHSPLYCWGWESANCTSQTFQQLLVRFCQWEALVRDQRWQKEKSVLLFARTSQAALIPAGSCQRGSGME